MFAAGARLERYESVSPLGSGGRASSLSASVTLLAASPAWRAVPSSTGRLPPGRGTIRRSSTTSETQAKAIALTIDDGPDAATTPEILRVLEQNGAHGHSSSSQPGSRQRSAVAAIVAEGHELGNHLVRDEPSLKLSPAEFERQLVESHAVLSRFATLRWFRPGSGKYDERMLATLEAHGYRCALGSVYPFDPQIRWSWFSRRFILSNVQPGSVVILHDWDSKGRRTVHTLSKVLPGAGKAWISHRDPDGAREPEGAATGGGPGRARSRRSPRRRQSKGGSRMRAWSCPRGPSRRLP